MTPTALVAAGATVVLFTTGRGTPLGFPAPTLKIASNSTLAERKPHPLPLLHAADAIGIAPADCVYVGDDARDIASARAAG